MVTPDNCFYLTIGAVRQIHVCAIELFGGSDGVRDIALLESAVAAPQASFGGRSVYGDVIEIAAAYLFYICRNHPFVDGNKRAALGACLHFLHINGIPLPPDSSDWETLTLDVAASRINREQATEILRLIMAKKTG
ncbi:MAG: type II toxin-antitoxin system death-on-curing family toxin [Puniceicoccales bacterium]|jgi:death-on-curing protein|nr:type II toxin-antitoxin system death-on-curing family toxin [Puniceicoccales bacterium]